MRRIAAILVLSAAVIWIYGFIFRQQPDRRNRVYTPDMYNSPAYETQSVNPVFADGKTEQPPVPGTIQRGQMPLHYGAGDSGAVRAGEELSIPFDSLTAADLERGRSVYNSFCAPCHGTDGRGTGPVARRGYPPPPSIFLQNTMEMPDGRMFHILTYGQKNMPGYAAQINRIDRWKTVAYVRQLQDQYLQQQQQARNQQEQETTGDETE